MQLRPYQIDAQTAVLSQWNEGKKRTLLVLPTGCGKTVVFANIAKNRVEEGQRVLILAHRGELLEQAADKLRKACGIESSLEKAESTSIGALTRVTVGSVQTLMNQKRLDRFPRDYFGTIIIDEAHHALSDSYQKVLNYFNSANILGVTATPDRGDMRNLGTMFDSKAYEYSMSTAIREGYLCPVKAQMIPLNISLSDVKTQCGDYQDSALGDALEPYLEAIATEIVNYAKDRKTVVFLPLISTSQKFTELLNKKNLKAREVNGMSSDRKEILDDFEKGRFNVLCNSMLLTEGWDCPSVDCVVVLRPTKVRALYQQMVGRGMRLSPETGKKDLLLLDFLWMTEKHDLCRPSSLVGKNISIKEKMDEIVKDSAQAVDLIEVEEKAESKVVEEREKALAEKLEEMKRRKKQLVDPLQFALSINAEDLSDYVPTFLWEKEPVTDKQKSILDKMGIDSSVVTNKGMASVILDRLIRRRDEKLATPKQIRLLENKGFSKVGTWTFEQASKMIGRLAECGWQMWKLFKQGIKPSEYIPE